MKLLDAVLARPVGTANILSVETVPHHAPYRALEQRAIEVGALFPLSKGAVNLLEGDPQVGVAIERFMDAGFLPDARRLLAYSLEKRDSIWWAYLCAMESHRHRDMTPEQIRGLDLILAWLLNPTEILRKQCKEAVKACGSTSIAGILCFAIWQSGGSVSPYAKRHIEPKPFVCAKLCATVVYLASVFFDPGRYRDYLKHFIQTGIKVATRELPLPGAGESSQS